MCVCHFSSVLTLCDRMDYSPLGSSVHGILQERIRERAAIPSSRGSSRPWIKPESLALQADSLPLSHLRSPVKYAMLLLLSHFSRVGLCVTHRRQPIRLPHPWDSPGKNTGVGCHFLLQGMKVKSENKVHSVVSDPQRPHGLQPTRLLRPWDFPGRSTGVACHCLLQSMQ